MASDDRAYDSGADGPSAGGRVDGAADGGTTLAEQIAREVHTQAEIDEYYDLRTRYRETPMRRTLKELEIIGAYIGVVWACIVLAGVTAIGLLMDRIMGNYDPSDKVWILVCLVLALAIHLMSYIHIRRLCPEDRAVAWMYYRAIYRDRVCRRWMHIAFVISWGAGMMCCICDMI